MPSTPQTVETSPIVRSEPTQTSELSGVSTESQHRVRTPLPVDDVAAMEFETVPAQAEPVGSTRTLVLAAIGVVLAVIIIVGVIIVLR